MDDIPASISFPEEELKVKDYWGSTKAFETSLKLSEGKPEFTFYDGPPFATGLPHYGHLLAGTIKDTVTRYAHQTGHHVRRRFGWDCHGLPVEYEIDQALGIKSRDDVLKMGIKTYNEHCRGIVSRYTKEWEGTVSRLGRWIDFKNDYKTMDPEFMESVWWVFKTLFEKGLVYRGHKVMPYSTGCSTPLSNFEAGLNYKNVHDPSVTIAFFLKDDPNAAFLAWTSTPWTLPSNLALCVHPELEYLKVKDKASGRTYYIAEARLVQLYPAIGGKKWKPEMAADLYEIEGKLVGADLVGISYKPLFPYFGHREGTSFRVVSDAYVTSEDGTGIVHQAPAFGEDDNRVCTAHGIVAKGEDMPCPVDASGNFTAEVTDFAGQYVKDCDAGICAALKAQGNLIHKDSFLHSYPFCWRSETPLIYKAVPSLFVAVESMRERLLANNDETYWVPSFVKEKRFHNWLREAKDWAVSRNRFWGTPIPLWVSDDGEEMVAIGSIQELKDLSGVTVTDLHRENIDHITIPSKKGKGDLKRVDEVFDCWFESGSMPYAQLHYPFENKERLEKGFPADFIAEGLDQTRGWFYTLMVLSTALFDKPAFKNLIVNGLVLASDGKKMSKRLKNYPPPTDVVDKYGADCLRLYLVNSPVVRAEPLKFNEGGVLGVVKEVYLPWFNAFRFFAQQVERWEGSGETKQKFKPSPSRAAASTNVMDIWVQADIQDLIRFVHAEMKGYRLYTVVPRLVKTVKSLTNWYVRLNRLRLKGAEGPEESLTGLCCLYEVLLTMAQVMSPLSPFFAEYLYQHLRKLHPNYGKGGPEDIGSASSVHHLMIPTNDPSRLNHKVQAEMDILQTVIDLGRVARERKGVSLKTPVKELLVVSRDPLVSAAVSKLKSYVASELNTWTVTPSSDESKWCQYTAVANNKTLGKRLGKAFGAVKKAIGTLSNQAIVDFQSRGSAATIDIEGHTLGADDLIVKMEFKGDAEVYEAANSDDGKLVVILDVRQDDTVLNQKRARQAVTMIQKLRKKAGLKVSDKVEAFLSPDPVVFNAIEANVALVKDALGYLPLPSNLIPSYAVSIAEDTVGLSTSTNKHERIYSFPPPAGAISAHDAAVIPSFAPSLDCVTALAYRLPLLIPCLVRGFTANSHRQKKERTPHHLSLHPLLQSQLEGKYVTAYLVRQCIHVNTEQLAAKATKSELDPAALTQFLVSCDYDRVVAEKQVTLTLDGKASSFVNGSDFFSDAVAKIKVGCLAFQTLNFKRES
ncbi:unnamed protein product [Chrysoparadoxa australica]